MTSAVFQVSWIYVLFVCLFECKLHCHFGIPHQGQCPFTVRGLESSD